MTQVNVEDAGLDYSRQYGFKKNTIDIDHSNLNTDLVQANANNMDAGLDYSREHGFKEHTIDIKHDQLEEGDLHQAKEENMS